ncbi:hypothetical protein C8R44DRAFT_113499 [Mycena epipterygia]|nr:hypothetical protein C8R44DRAFT_113499 [Mycena epipterygia]
MTSGQLDVQTRLERLEARLVDYEAFKVDYEGLKAGIETLKGQVVLYQPVTRRIYRSHLLKGAAARLRWESFDGNLSRNILTTPADITEIDLVYRSFKGSNQERLGHARTAYLRHHGKLPQPESTPQKDAYKKALEPPPAAAYNFLKEQYVEGVSGISNATLDWLQKEIVCMVVERNDAAHVMTAHELATFIKQEEGTPDQPHLAQLFWIIFGFPYTSISTQPPEVQEFRAQQASLKRSRLCVAFPLHSS